MKKYPIAQSFKLLALLLCFLVSGSFCYAQANITPAGNTIVAQGIVQAKNEQQDRELKRRSPVYQVDTVTTEENSRTQLRMSDGGLLALKELSHLDIASYHFDPKTAQGSVAMTLVKGGLRTITGALTNKEKNYQLSTPVASIGVRGTHYSAHMDQKDLLLAVWDGEIVVQVTVGIKPVQFSLGKKQKYSMARVKANGEVEFFLQVPEKLALGHTPPFSKTDYQATLALTQEQQEFSQAKDEEYKPRFDLANYQYDQTGDEWVDNQEYFASLLPVSDGISRTGTATFGLIDHSFASSVGALSDITMNLTVDFNLSRVPTGNLSFTDSGGEWFTTFNGVITDTSLDVNINFASHGNNVADGAITGLFVDDASKVFGDIQLSEVNNTNINAGGNFVLGEVAP